MDGEQKMDDPFSDHKMPEWVIAVEWNDDSLYVVADRAIMADDIRDVVDKIVQNSQHPTSYCRGYDELGGIGGPHPFIYKLTRGGELFVRKRKDDAKGEWVVIMGGPHDGPYVFTVSGHVEDWEAVLGSEEAVEIGRSQRRIAARLGFLKPDPDGKPILEEDGRPLQGRDDGDGFRRARNRDDDRVVVTSVWDPAHKCWVDVARYNSRTARWEPRELTVVDGTIESVGMDSHAVLSEDGDPFRWILVGVRPEGVGEFFITARYNKEASRWESV